MARGSYLLLKKLGIDRVKYLIGPSLGGMQALALSSLYNNIVENIILISTATQAHPYAIAIRSLQREVIRKDPLWNNGFYDYDKPPLNGVRIARKIGMTSYDPQENGYKDLVGRELPKKNLIKIHLVWIIQILNMR